MKSFVNSDFTKLTFDSKCLVIKKNGVKVSKEESCLDLISDFETDESHVHSLLLLPQSYTIPKPLSKLKENEKLEESKELFFETCISAKQRINLTDIPLEFIPRIRNVKEDPRLACSAVCAFDETYSMAYMFLITDDMIYALYERTPNKDLENYISNPHGIASFTSIIPLIKRSDSNILNKSGDYSRLALSFKSNVYNDKNIVSWYIDGVCLFQVSNLGCRLEDKYQVVDYGGINKKVGVGELKFGFGHYSFLDFQLVNNYSRELIKLDISGKFPIYRSASGLLKMRPVEEYKEPYPNFSGDHSRIVSSVSFAANEISQLNGENMMSQVICFSRGVQTKIKYFKVYLKDIEISCISSKNDEKNKQPIIVTETVIFETIDLPNNEDHDKILYISDSSKSLIEDKPYSVCESSVGQSSVCESSVCQSSVCQSSTNESSIYRRISRKQLELFTEMSESASVHQLSDKSCWICRKICRGSCCEGMCGSSVCEIK